jgi:hypothetical protein
VLRQSIQQGSQQLDQMRTELGDGLRAGARLRKLIDSRDYKTIRRLLSDKDTNLLTKWRFQTHVVTAELNDPKRAAAFVESYYAFLVGNSQALDAESFDGLVATLGTAWKRADKKREERKLGNQWPFIRAWMTLWLSKQDPNRHIYLANNTFAQMLTAEPAALEPPFTAEKYQLILDGAQRLRHALTALGPQWAPRDLTDVQTLLHIHFHVEGVKATMRLKADSAGPSEGRKPGFVPSEIGVPYLDAVTSPSASQQDPYTVDPDVIDRGTAGHTDTQNGLAAALRAMGIAPLSPKSGEPEFDIAWQLGSALFVGEGEEHHGQERRAPATVGLGPSASLPQRH